MRRKTGIEKQVLRLRLREITIVVICLLCVVIFLAQCNKEATPGTDASTAEGLAGTGEGAAVTPDSILPPVETRSDTEADEAIPTRTPEPTVTPTEGERVAAISVQQFTPPYIPNINDCIEAVQSEQIENCMSLESAQDITHTVWEQLFPNTDFFILHFSSFDLEHDFQHSFVLAAWQDEHQYVAKTFDQLLSVNNIRITDENYELIAQAFALMTIPTDRHFYRITFTDWEAIDIQDAFSHFNRRLQAWTELGGQEVEWYFGFEDGNVLEVLGPETALLGFEVGDYIPLEPISDEGPNYGAWYPLQYRFSINQ